MINPRVQLGIVAVVYAVFGVFLLFDARMLISLAQSPSSSPMARNLTRNVSIPWVVAVAVGHLLLSGLSLGFPRLTRPWRIVAIGVSLGATISYIGGAMRGTAATVPRYLALEPTDYLHLAIVLLLYWGFALILCFRSYLLWRQVRASNNLSRRP